MARNCHGKRSNLAEKTPRQKEKTHGGESWPSGFFFAVSLFLSAVRFLLLSRVFLFCREVISFAVTVVGHRTFCCRSHTKLKFREAFCFFSPGSNVVVLSSQYPHIIAPKNGENMHCHICWICSHTLLTGASFL